MINIDDSIVAFEPPFVAISNRTRETCLNDQPLSRRVRQATRQQFLLNAQAAEQRLGNILETISIDGETDDLAREFPPRIQGLLSRFSLELIDRGEEKRSKSRTPQEVFLHIRVGLSRVGDSVDFGGIAHFEVMRRRHDFPIRDPPGPRPRSSD